jgi:hypothetical protein
MADKLAETGLRGAFFGLESLHPTASRIVGKGWSGKSAREFVPELVHNIWKNKITAHCGLIVGLPGENEDDLQNTVTWVNDNMINVVFFGLQVTNNLHERSYISEFERNAEKYGFKFDSKGKWYNDIWSRDSVLAFAAKLNPKRKRLNFAGFNHIALHSLGYANEEIISQHQDTIKDSNEFKLRKNQFIQNYFNALRTL